MIFEAQGRADVILEISSRLLVLMVVPVPIVIAVYLELDSVITGRDRREIPLELPHLVALIEMPQRDGKKIRNEAAGCNRGGHLVVLLVQP